jgi:WD40 repeat protein
MRGMYCLTLLMLLLPRMGSSKPPVAPDTIERLSNPAHFKGPVAFSPNGRFLVCGKGERDVVILDVAHRKIRHTLHPETIFHYSATFSPDSRRLATGGHDADVRLWDVGTGKLVRTLEGAESGNRTYALAFTPDGKRLAAACYHGILELWNVRTGKRTQEYELAWRAWSTSISPNGKRLAVAINQTRDPEGGIVLIDLQANRVMRTLTTPQPMSNMGDLMWQVAYSSDGKLLACGSQQALRLWNARTGRLFKTLAAHTNLDHPVDGLVFSPVAPLLIVSSSDRTIRFWNIRSGKQVRRIDTRKETSGLAISPDGHTLAYIEDGVLTLRTLSSNR